MFPANRTDEELAKFVKDSSNKTAVNTVIAGGELTLSGLNIALKLTNTTVGLSAAKLPLIPLAQRNSMIILNKGTVPIFIGNSDVTISGAFEGWEIDAGSFFSLDITEMIEIYAISGSASVNVKIMEFA